MRSEITRLARGARRRLSGWRQLNQRVRALEDEVATLRKENNQLRRDSLRVAEIADLVVERLSHGD
ncbi:hypothetical protein [Aeromicrobium piscarium]|uniref:Uncharacterized protein n=1 Tax=Aeromicrobium piscarium TaxID=2590901 RepID=A0A554S7L6_9ACTN|nr:hypothetical protein [Aeromicrobium piscarium]TSD62347.1 hypothetical protein FNM00_11980 [Aeromicrobium piscarium]